MSPDFVFASGSTLRTTMRLKSGIILLILPDILWYQLYLSFILSLFIQRNVTNSIIKYSLKQYYSTHVFLRLLKYVGFINPLFTIFLLLPSFVVILDSFLLFWRLSLGTRPPYYWLNPYAPSIFCLVSYKFLLNKYFST